MPLTIPNIILKSYLHRYHVKQITRMYIAFRKKTSSLKALRKFQSKLDPASAQGHIWFSWNHPESRGAQKKKYLQ